MKASFIVLLLAAIPSVKAASIPRAGEELRFCLHGAPKTFDPLQAADSPSEAVRFLTAGVLLRMDRRTQQLVPELAESWKTLAGNRQIEFTLRVGAKFSDGSAVRPEDVVWTLKKLQDPALGSPLADQVRSGMGEIRARVKNARTVVIEMPKPAAVPAMQFESMPVIPEKGTGTAGPYVVSSYRTGSEIVLKRNPHYWKRDGQGRMLPYAPTLRIRIQTNRELELMDFERGDLDMVTELPPEIAERIAAKDQGRLVDLGLTLDALLMWFNQTPGSALPAHKKAWFQSSAFRKAMSLAMNREDICRIAYRGKARPGVGPVSPANRVWANPAVKADPYNPGEALRRLGAAGFKLEGGALRDRGGNAVEFSVITNAGNKTHERVLGLLQQDWRKIGVKLTIVTLDFPSLIERITRSYAYEACLLPMTNIGLDPSEQMNVWLSSSALHQWNPGQATPATAWEKEIDELMGKVSTSIRQEERKKAFDRVQAIASEQQPFIYVAHPRAQAAVSPKLKITGAPLWPYLMWGLEQASLSR